MSATFLLAAFAFAVLAGVAFAEAMSASQGRTWKHLVNFALCAVASGAFIDLARSAA